MTAPVVDTPRRVGICGSIYPAPAGDCICGLEPHDDDTDHECLAVGCEQTWKTRRARRTA